MYTEVKNDKNELKGVVRDSDGTFVPLDTNNRDYLEYSEWVGSGNVPTPDPHWDIANVKARKVLEINGACRRIIYSKWPQEIQGSINMGIYPEPLPTQCRDDIANMIAESNVFTAEVDALATIDDVLNYTYNYTTITGA